MAAEEENKRHCLANDNGSCSDESLDPRILRIAEAIGRQLAREHAGLRPPPMTTSQGHDRDRFFSYSFICLARLRR